MIQSILKMRFFSIAMVLVLVGNIACSPDGGDDPLPPPQDDPEAPDAQAELTAQLSESGWNVNSVERENSDVSTDYEGFVLKLNTNGSYTTQNGFLAWEPEGNWKYPNSETTSQILIDNETLMDLELSDNSLTLSFQLEEDVFGGRIKTVSAGYEFVLTR